MIYVYPAIFHRDGDAYWAEFPDLPGCQTFGDTLQDTLVSAQEALSGYLLTLLEEGKTLAAPSDIAALSCEGDSFATLISSDLSKYDYPKSVEKTLTIPSWLNDRAIASGINFSQTLQDALINKLTM